MKYTQYYRYKSYERCAICKTWDKCDSCSFHAPFKQYNIQYYSRKLIKKRNII